MPNSNTPYDPQPERKDALGELAREGYKAVSGDHSARLKSLQDRLELPVDSVQPTGAAIRQLKPRKWLAIAAGIAVFVVAGITFFNYETPKPQVAQVIEPTQEVQKDREPSPIVTESASTSSANEIAESLSVPASDPAHVKLQERELPQKQLKESGTSEEDLASAPLYREAKAPIAEATSANKDNPSRNVPPATKSKVSSPPAISAEIIEEAEKETENKADFQTDNLAEEATKSFRMERAPAVETREITGEVLEPSGVPVIGAILTVEETGQQVVTDQKGEFRILVPQEAVVGNISGEGYNELLFDLTAGEEFRLFLPRLASSIPSAQLKGKSIGLRLIAPKAAPFAAFDAHVAAQRSSFSGEQVTVQFEVNRFGRPRHIITGPGTQNRDAVKELKDWLKSGPDWPAPYQRKTWRYAVVMP